MAIVKTPRKGIVEAENDEAMEAALEVESTIDPSVAMVQSENHNTRVEKSATRNTATGAQIFTKDSFDSDEDDAVSTQEKSTVVKPNSTFSCVIGLRRYDFTKNVSVTVPVSVKDVLANGNKIYP